MADLSDSYKQNLHSQQQKLLRKLMDNFGVTRSQARKALQADAQADIIRRNEEAGRNQKPNLPEIPQPKIQRTEQVLPPIKHVEGKDAPEQAPQNGQGVTGDWTTVQICDEESGEGLLQVLTRPVP